jgi:hypothetical protein
VGGRIGAVWAVVGFSLILLDAINRLSGMALDAFAEGFTLPQWVGLVLVVLFMAYTEGYRGFQKSFSPRCAARAYHLYKNPEPLSVALAPLFIMGFFRAERRPFLIAWVGTMVIVMLVFALHVTPQPWRGIVDCGVVVGLSWGLISFLLSVWRVFSSGRYDVLPAVPEAGK